ncbi:MAG: PQQ-binding-like beta-propeller repeat protein, partial [Opitutaceae bacterium]
VLAEGRLYVFNENGHGPGIEAGRACTVRAGYTLGGGVWASPAVAGRALFVRSTTHLYRLEK